MVLHLFHRSLEACFCSCTQAVGVLSSAELLVATVTAGMCMCKGEDEGAGEQCFCGVI